MDCNNFRFPKQRKSLFVTLASSFLVCISAMSVNAASDAAIHEKSLSQSAASDVVNESLTPEASTSMKRARPKPNRNYAGASIGATGIARAAKSEEKKYTMHKRVETSRAQHAKSVVEHSDSPELQARNEKLRKIKEQFRTELEKREERNVGKSDSTNISK